MSSDDDEGNLAHAPSGYLWDACGRAGLSYRSYGEYGQRVSTADGTAKMEGRVPGLVGHVCPEFGLGNGTIRDTDGCQTSSSRNSTRSRRQTLAPVHRDEPGRRSHYGHGLPGRSLREACVASNDLALGRTCRGVSKSKFWPETAIFVIEDDAQNGPDHVDAHRTVGLVISPYTKRGLLDSTQYSTVSMIRTMELILGLPPLSQFDAAATPMFPYFSDIADLTPYTHEPARIDSERQQHPARLWSRAVKSDGFQRV